MGGAVTAVVAPGRPRKATSMQVWLSSSESEEYHTDSAFRQKLLRALKARAATKGRRFFEVFDAKGEFLHLGEVG
jgi:uncharacterized protein (AIM24 family)